MNIDILTAPTYEKFLHRLTLRYGIYVSIIALPLLFVLLYYDLMILELPRIILAIRGIPIIAALALLGVLNSPFRNNVTLVRALYLFFFFSGMAMMSALALITCGTEMFSAAVLGMIVVIFGILITSPFGVWHLLPVYLVPFTLFLAGLYFLHDETIIDFKVIINPFIAIVGSLIIAEVQNRNRRRNFEQLKIIDEKNSIIALHNAHMQTDLELARRVQHNLIPQNTPESEYFNLYTLYLPVHEVGGDFFDFIHFHEKGKTGIIIGDVSGHGVHAALITSMIKMLVETSGSHRPSPEKLLRYINDNLYGMTGENFFTAFYGIFDPVTGTLTYARAGHTYPLLIRNGGKELKPLKSRGNILGSFQNLTFEEIEISLYHGDKILFYTDGLTEERNSEGIEFETVFNSMVASCAPLPVNRLVQRLYQDLETFTGRSKFEDDICIVALEITSGKQREETS